MGILRSDMIKICKKTKANLLEKVVQIFEENNIDYWLEFGTLLACVRDKKIISWDSDFDIGIWDLTEIERLSNAFLKKDLVLSVERRKFFTDAIEVRDKNIPIESYFHVDLFEFRKLNGNPTYQWLLRENIFSRLFNSIYVILDGKTTVKAGIISIKKMVLLNNLSSLLPQVFRESLMNVFGVLDLFFSTKRMLVFSELKTKSVTFCNLQVKIPEDAEDHLLLNYGYNWRIPNKNFSGGGKEFIARKMNGIEICMLPEVNYEI